MAGGSSGLGLATVELLLQQGAIVTAGDLNESPISHPNLGHMKTNVTDWTSLTALFKHALAHHSTINHVFANAGVAPRTRYLEENLDSNGDLLEPTFACIDVNLRGVINTCALALHYMRKQEPDAASHSIVVTGSGFTFSPDGAVDYGIAKHGVLGLMRGIVRACDNAKIPIRANCICPGWMATAMCPEPLLIRAKALYTQPAGPARAVALFMADEARNGQMIYAPREKYREIEQAVMLKCIPEIAHGEEDADTVQIRLYEEAAKMKEKQKSKM